MKRSMTTRKKHTAKRTNLGSSISQLVESKYFSAKETRSKLLDNFFDVDSTTLSKSLLGQILCRRIPETGQVLRGRIVETEAYPGTGDPASHSFNGKTPRNEPMFMKPGTTYVYFTYGMYHCFNVSSRGDGSAVLIRAIEPLDGIEEMSASRSKKSVSPLKKLKLHELCNGPAKLCMALQIDKQLINKLDLSESDLIWIEADQALSEEQIGTSKRIGLGKGIEIEAQENLLRFFQKGSIFVTPKYRTPPK